MKRVRTVRSTSTLTGWTIEYPRRSSSSHHNHDDRSVCSMSLVTLEDYGEGQYDDDTTASLSQEEQDLPAVASLSTMELSPTNTTPKCVVDVDHSLSAKGGPLLLQHLAATLCQVLHLNQHSHDDKNNHNNKENDKSNNKSNLVGGVKARVKPLAKGTWNAQRRRTRTAGVGVRN